MNNNKTHDPAIQAAVKDSAQEQCVGDCDRQPNDSQSFNAQNQEPTAQNDPDKVFRDQWNAMSWERVRQLLFEKWFPGGMDEETYGMYAFCDMALEEKVDLLSEMVAGRRSVDIHWPLVGEVFDEISGEPKEPLDFEAISKLIIHGYRLLSHDRREFVREQRLGMRIWSILESPLEDWQVRVIDEIGGGVVEESITGDWFDNCEITQWLGMKPLENVLFRLDFRKRSSKPVNTWDVVEDAFGVCCFDRDAPSITLFMDAIKDCALRTGTIEQVKMWRQLAFTHKMARMAYLMAEDQHGTRNSIVSNEWTEQLADYITFQWASKNCSVGLFEQFMSILPTRAPIGSLKTCPIEMFRFYLWLLRHGNDEPNATRNASWIREVYPQLPVITTKGNTNGRE
jgi:hypothetical protein